MSIYCPINDCRVTYLACQDCRPDPQCKKFFCLVTGCQDLKDYSIFEKKLDHLLSNQNGKVVIMHEESNLFSARYSAQRGYDSIPFPPHHIQEMISYISRMERKGIIIFLRADGRKEWEELAGKYGIQARFIRK